MSSIVPIPFFHKLAQAWNKFLYWAGICPFCLTFDYVNVKYCGGCESCVREQESLHNERYFGEEEIDQNVPR